MKEAGIPYKREFELSGFEPDSPEGNRIDFLIADKLIVDIKAKKFITKEDYNQMMRYLESASLELGMIVNFRCTYLKPKRVLNYRLKNSDNSDVDSDNSDRLK